MLHEEQSCEYQTTREDVALMTRIRDREKQDPIQQTIVLKMDVVNDQKTWRKKNRQRNDVASCLTLLGS